jgi:hypothetical protein
MKPQEGMVTRYGFVWNGISVERICKDKRMGSFIGIYSGNEQMEIRITPGGKISVYSHCKGRGPIEV